MDSIGDYIYLIIIVVAALSSVFKKKKIAEQKNAEPETYEETEDEIEVDYPQRRFYEVETPTIAYETLETYNKNNDRTINYETAKTTSLLQERKQAVKNETTKNKVNHFSNEIEITPLEFSLNSVEEARRAFIYSEIFNRKY